MRAAGGGSASVETGHDAPSIQPTTTITNEDGVAAGSWTNEIRANPLTEPVTKGATRSFVRLSELKENAVRVTGVPNTAGTMLVSVAPGGIMALSAKQANCREKAYENGQLMEAPGAAWLQPLVGKCGQLGEHAIRRLLFVEEENGADLAPLADLIETLLMDIATFSDSAGEAHNALIDSGVFGDGSIAAAALAVGALDMATPANFIGNPRNASTLASRVMVAQKLVERYKRAQEKVIPEAPSLETKPPSPTSVTSFANASPSTPPPAQPCPGEAVQWDIYSSTRGWRSSVTGA